MAGGLREIGPQHKEKETKSDHPVELARVVKGAREKDAEKVQEDHDQEEVAAPVVDVPDETSKENSILEDQNRFIGLVGKRNIKKLQHQSCPEKKHHKDKSHAA